VGATHKTLYKKHNLLNIKPDTILLLFNNNFSVGNKPPMNNNKRLLFLISLGSILEYYDYAIFIYLAPVIGHELIPVQNQLINLILSYAIFAVGAFFRPFGGLVFSHFGDTRGRSRVFIYTILFMALPTLAIAFIPPIAKIGVLATVLLITFRILQGVAIGGEVPGSIVFGYETAPMQRKALSSSIVVMGTNIGFFLASMVCMILAGLHLSFGSWRLAFVLGGIFGFISYFLRKSLTETTAFIQYKESIAHEEVPLNILFKKHKKSVLQLIAIGGFLASVLAVFTFYMPVYLSTFYHFPMPKLMEFNSFTIIIFIIGSLIAGIFDQYFAKGFFLIFIPIFTILVFALFKTYPLLNLNQIFVIHIAVLLSIGIVCGRLPVLCATFFPVQVRYTGVAFVYNISFGIIAGSTQMFLTWLIKVTNLLWIPGVYLLFFAFFAFIAMLSVANRTLIDYRH
jgi:MFS family permease